MKRGNDYLGLVMFAVILVALTLTVTQMSTPRTTITTNVTIENNTAVSNISYSTGPTLECPAQWIQVHCQRKATAPLPGGSYYAAALADGSCPADFEPLANDSCQSPCCGSCGYTWCELQEKCLREWEEPCVPDATVLTTSTTTTTIPTCGGFVGRICPTGYDCVSPVGADVPGICKLHPSCAIDADCPTGKGCHNGACEMRVYLT